jgi:uncharacterized cupredoxin-like copper-binding protein
MLRKRVVAGIAVAAIASALTACGDGDEGGTAEAPDGTGAVAVVLGETDATNMFMRLSQPSVPAGSITFTVTNEGTKEHEFEVFRTSTAAGDFAVGPDDKAEDPADAEELTEVEGIEAGETETVTLELEPGHYALICNEPHHYEGGMYADFTVT